MLGELKVDFLNVGHGDCIVVNPPSNNLTMVDINNGATYDNATFEEIMSYFQPLDYSESIRIALSINEKRNIMCNRGYDIALTNPIEFLKQNYPLTNIFRYIQSHPHMDHMRGLAALRESGISITNFWDTNHNITPDLQEEDKVDWQEYQRLRSSGSGCTVLHLKRESSGIYYNENPTGVRGGDGIEILHPLSTLLCSPDNPNDLSYVFRISYNGISIILGGDAGNDVWKEIAQYYGSSLKCTVLKASHHGRDSGYYEEAVKLMNPDYVIVSVGKKPDTDASNKYRKHCDNVWSTRWKGNISLSIPSYGQARIDTQYNR